MAQRSPVVSRRWLALELRRLRRERGLAQKEAGQSCGWSGARLSYLENAQQNVVEDDLDKLLELYEVPLDQRSHYYDAARDARSRGWWEAYSDVIPDYLVPYIGLEQGASQIRTFQTMVMPGLLQTPEYAGSLLRHGPRRRTSRSVDRLVGLRMRRQDIITRPEDAADLVAVIDEGVLLRAPRGERDVLTAQIQNLIQMAGAPNVTIHVLPFDESIPDFAYESFVVLTLALQDPDPDIVYVENVRGADYIEGSSDIESYLLTFDSLIELALSPDESLATMRRYLKGEHRE